MCDLHVSKIQNYAPNNDSVVDLFNDVWFSDEVLYSYFDLRTECSVLFLPWRHLETGVSLSRDDVRGETTRNIQWVIQNDVIVSFYIARQER